MSRDFSKKLSVLIVENNPVDTAMLCGMLSKSTLGSFDIKSADSLNYAFEILSKHPVDVCILDLNLKDAMGIDTLKKLNKHYPQISIVVNTGAYQDNLGLQAVTQGAQDYLIKGKYKTYGLIKSLYYAVERKKAEEELQNAYNRLKETQAQLIQAEKMNVVGGLASGVAHEVKNPLATILYGVEFLNTKLEQADEQVKLTIQSIKDATHKANEIVKDLLDFASLSNLKIKPESINEVIEQSLHLIKHQCDKNSVKIVSHFTNRIPKIRIDKNRIEQVIVDLLLNAILAMPKGGELIINTCAKNFNSNSLMWHGDPQMMPPDGARVVILDIDDTGIGIPEDHLSKIFDPFFTTRRAAGGVGLGLSIARTIILSHGGSIMLNNYEKGARARLIFKATS